MQFLSFWRAYIDYNLQREKSPPTTYTFSQHRKSRSTAPYMLTWLRSKLQYPLFGRTFFLSGNIFQTLFYTILEAKNTEIRKKRHIFYFCKKMSKKLKLIIIYQGYILRCTRIQFLEKSKKKFSYL